MVGPVPPLMPALPIPPLALKSPVTPPFALPPLAPGACGPAQGRNVISPMSHMGAMQAMILRNQILSGVQVGQQAVSVKRPGVGAWLENILKAAGRRETKLKLPNERDSAPMKAQRSYGRDFQIATVIAAEAYVPGGEATQELELSLVGGDVAKAKALRTAAQEVKNSAMRPAKEEVEADSDLEDLGRGTVQKIAKGS